ncbi:MAG: nitroreductase [Hyphomicrobiaceae bacterium]|jgi:nitroreductase
MSERPKSDETIFDVLYSCRAMRRYKPDPVPEEMLLQLVDAALQGPSGSNAQNWTFVIVRDADQKRKIADLWQTTWDFYMETLARADARPGENLEARERMLRAGTFMVERLSEAPAIIFAGVKRDEQMAKVLSSPSTVASLIKHFGFKGFVRTAVSGTRIGSLAEGSTAYPCVQNLLLAARALGLGAVLATPQFFVPGEFEKILGLPPKVTLAAAIPVGWPSGRFGPVSRPNPSAVVHWDRFGS